MPSPPWARSTPGSTCVNGSNTRPRASASRPMPESATCSATNAPSRRADTVIEPPGGVYLQALCSRLSRICASRARSARIASDGGGGSSTRRWPRASLVVRTPSTAAPSADSAVTVSTSSSMWPCVIRDTSSRSSTSRRSCRSWRRAIAAACRLVSASDASSASTCTALVSPASGLRSSWPSIARNSSLRRSVSCSASIAERSSVTSRWVPITLTACRSASRSTTRPRASTQTQSPCRSRSRCSHS